MSGTTQGPAASTTAAVAAVTRGTPETLQSQTFIVSVMLIVVLAGTVFGVFLRASQEVQSTISSLVIGGILTGLCGFYYSSSKHQTSTDTPTTPTVSAPPATVTTTTGNPP